MIAEGSSGVVYDNNDGTVTKVFKEGECNELLAGIHVPKMKYVANTISVNLPHSLLKEKIDHLSNAPDIIDSLCMAWEDSLLCGYEMFDFADNYLTSSKDNKFTTLRTVEKFREFILLSMDFNCLETFNQLVSIIQELKDNRVYLVDWNPENFGLKNGHLALFELGEAKVKKDRKTNNSLTE